MPDLIERKDALSVFGDIHPLDYSAQAYANQIAKIPAVDAEPVRHGRWKNNCCTYCGVKASMRDDHDGYMDYDLSPYCSYCGARMDKEN